MTNVDLGFIEEPDDPELLRSHFFPSKVGGKPAWLNLRDLPDIDQIRCGFCGKPCIFLMQVYAPNESNHGCFHRTLFIFICSEAECCKKNESKNFVVFRSQLARRNSFYSDSPPEELYADSGAVAPKCEDYAPLCIVCGCRGSKKCGKCRKVSYCSKEHQVLHWQAGHKSRCATEQLAVVEGNNDLLFPEHDLVMESEQCTNSEKNEDPKVDDIKDWSGDVVSDPSLCSDKALKDLDAMAKKVEDKAFEKFKKVVSFDPEQVLRYNRHGQPLWVASTGIPTDEDISKCVCGAKRSFEFQVLPQLLCSLKVDRLSASIDWGTLAVYTCSEDCGTTAYVQEFIWKQDFNDKA